MYRNASTAALISLAIGCATESQAPITADAQALEEEEDRKKKSAAKDRDALEVLEKYCYSCHGLNGSNSGGFAHVLDVDRMISEGKIVPGSADESPLFDRVVSGEMPPPTQTDLPSVKEVDTIRQWINDRAFTDDERVFISTADEYKVMRDDLNALGQSERRFIRYITLAHLYNAGSLDQELESYRVAISLLINRLSWAHEVVQPVSIDAPRDTIYRIDLRDYAWDDGDSQSTSALWDTLIENNTYAMLHIETENVLEVVTQTRTPVPVIRGDWFAATASKAPLYTELLRLPDDIDTLESELLLVDPAANIERQTVARSGFNESGVSSNNRIIERHNTIFGAYYKSYDFASSSGFQNIFDHPLGPGTNPAHFQPAGGEMIFELPNGLHAYYIALADGTRLDVAPNTIVTDPEQPDRLVINGLSCMSCHDKGLKPKEDEIRDHALANADLFSRSDLDQILGLYVEPDILSDLLKADKVRYRKSVEKAGGNTNNPDPTLALVREFEAAVDRKRAAVELGLTEAQLEVHLLNPDVGALLSVLRDDGGTLKRELFNEAFNEVACIVGFGLPLEETEDCEPPDYQGNRQDARLDVTQTAQTRTEPIPARLDKE